MTDLDVPAGRLYLGEGLDPASRERNGEAVLLEAADLTTHGVLVGMTGSGKTGLGVVMLEEALLQGIPTLVLDLEGFVSGLLDMVGVDSDPLAGREHILLATLIENKWGGRARPRPHHARRPGPATAAAQGVPVA
jgi:hypothetical protein